MTTHMAVASGVKTGTADCGLGIYSAAKALGLDFIDVTYEDYDFLIAEKLLDSPMIIELVQTLRSKEFQDRVKSLGGYKFENTGK